MSNKTTYKCWVKVNATKTITLHTPDLLDFQKFLDRDYPEWRFFNVYIKEQQIASFTRNNRATAKKVVV
jgi:hypothetical protein